MSASLHRLRYGIPEFCPIHTPWGVAQTATTAIPGEAAFVSTPSHGGYWVHTSLNKQIPEPFRAKPGWYEEDVDYAVVHYFLGERFRPEYVAEIEKYNRKSPDAPPFRERARLWLRSYRWRDWEAYSGEVVPESESSFKANDMGRLRHKDDFLGVSAWGEWHEKVPKGFVGILAAKGGRGTAAEPRTEERYFLVEASRYAARASFGHVVDPAVDRPWDGPGDR